MDSIDMQMYQDKCNEIDQMKQEAEKIPSCCLAHRECLCLAMERHECPAICPKYGEAE